MSNASTDKNSDPDHFLAGTVKCLRIYGPDYHRVMAELRNKIFDILLYKCQRVFNNADVKDFIARV